MLIKGVVIKNIKDYIKEKYPDNYQKWFDLLPSESQQIFEKYVFLNDWFSLQDGALIPSIIAADLFLDGDYDRFLFETGQYNGLKDLNGVYKLFMKIATLEYVLKKASLVFSTYYRAGSIKVEKAKNIELTLYGFDKGEEKWFVNISGWLDSMAQIVWKNSKKYRIENSFTETENNKVIGKIIVIEE